MTAHDNIWSRTNELGYFLEINRILFENIQEIESNIKHAMHVITATKFRKLHA
jgi:hypothetical protein